MSEAKAVAKAPVSNRGTYTPANIGFPVDSPDKTWHDLTPQQRKEWFDKHEQRWKTRFGRSSGDAQANMNWTRG
jgi:hypothetical protein